MLSSLLQKLPLAIAGILLIVAGLTIYFRSKNVTKSEFVRILKTTKYLQAWVLIFVILLTGIFSVFNHLKSKQSVMAVVALNYSEASQAQNSNGTRYNMAEIICDEVVEKAIKMGAFENVTVNQLKNCLSVYPYIQGDVNDEANYHISTEFVVEYHASKFTEHLNSENVITLITSAYKEYYIEKYTDKFSLTEQEKPDFSKMEYMDIVTYFNKETTAILNYLYGMGEKGASFVTENNTTFSSIAGKVHQFKETQIDENLKSLILQYGIVKDKSGYIDRLSYQNKNTDFDKQKNLSSFNLCNQAIDMYSEEMTRIVLVPTWDGSGKYYMGRTKVGIDELSVMATNYSDKVATNNKEIMDNDLVINKMQNAAQNGSANEQADALIASIDKSIENFTVEAIKAGREYSNYTMNQCIAVSISGTSLFSELKTIIIFAFLAYIAATMFSVSKKFPKASA
jgi:ribosomal protein S13